MIVARNLWLVVAAAALLSACSTPALMSSDVKAGCATLVAGIDRAAIALPTGGASIDSATLVPASPLAVAERGPTPASLITPAVPEYCKVLGRILPMDPSAPPILFQVNLPTQWNGRSVQYGGGGFNGVLISGLGLVPAARFDLPSPLGQGYVTVGTDSGHQNKPGEPPQAFALNDEALVNFAHASYKKVRDVSVDLMFRAYGRKPDKLYFVGSSEGGREGLTMAQRYPADFNGIFSRVPVINWTALQFAGTRNGLASMGDAWIRPASVKLVGDAVLATCDAADGVVDGLVSNPAGCRQRFDVTKLRCTGAPSDACLTDAQIRAVQTLHSPFRFDYPLANGVREYPGYGVSGEAAPAMGPTGGWGSWWSGSAAPAIPPVQANGIAWFYGSGAIQFFYARDAAFDVRKTNPNDMKARVEEVSALMDSTNPDLSAFRLRGGKLIVLEYMSDYAQTAYAAVRYVDSVGERMGPGQVADFLKFYTAPGVDHVGAGAPGNVDMLAALADWVERDKAPAGLQVVAQETKAPFAVTRARPLCEWPQWPRYKSGDVNRAESFECVR
jgi:Tannase and feruloyl esterase